MTQQVSDRTKQDEVIKYFVNGEEVTHAFQKAPERKILKLTMREILESAGFTPAEDFELARDSDHTIYAAPDEEVPVENGDRFTATSKGPTPTS